MGVRNERKRRENLRGSAEHDPIGTEIEVVLSPGGEIVFSWHSPVIQRLAGLLGRPLFEVGRWCG